MTFYFLFSDANFAYPNGGPTLFKKLDFGIDMSSRGELELSYYNISHKTNL